MSQGLAKSNFSQLVREATQIQGGHIDHAYWRDKNGFWNDPVVEHYTPYYSDHDGICTTLTKHTKKNELIERHHDQTNVVRHEYL